MRLTQAWNRSYAPATFREVWGDVGAFTTLRLARRFDRLEKEDDTHDFNSWALFAPNAHLARLNHDLAAAGVPPIDADWFWSTLLALGGKLMSHDSCTYDGDLLVRISATNDWITLATRPATVETACLKGILQTYERPSPRTKNLQYETLLGFMQDSDREREEVILADSAGLLRETCSANLIAVDQQGDWVTPSDNCLPGLTLRLFADFLGSERAIRQRLIRIDQMHEFAALWCCGTGRLICAISEIPEISWRAHDPSAENMRAHALQHQFRTFLFKHEDCLVVS